jgi:hypothetical protein
MKKPKLELSKIIELKNQGLSNVEIAKILDCSRSTITYYLNPKYHERGYFINRRNEIKSKAVEYKGGKCSICKYNKCLAALEFHHLNPYDKDEDLGSLTKQGKSFENLIEELDKCILVCANCHREIHSDLVKNRYNLPLIQSS